MADERATPLNQGFDKWLQITDGGKLQTWNGVDSPTPIIGDDPLVTKTELDDKASLSLNQGYVSEYSARVYQEGGTIQNGRRTAAPFISPAYEDAKMLLNASGGLDIADDGGRKVVNKIWDSSQEKNNQEFAGSDRPEFHKTLDGFEQVAVEKGSENLVPSLLDWATNNCSLVDAGEFWEMKADNVIDGIPVIGARIDGSANIFSDGDDGARSIEAKMDNHRYMRISTNIDGSGSTGRIHADFDLKEQELIGVLGGLAGTEYTVGVISSGEFAKYYLCAPVTEFASTRYSISLIKENDIGSSTIEGDWDGTERIFVKKPQPEISQYPTLFVDGTRLQPDSTITINEFASEMSVSFFVDIMRAHDDLSANQPIYASSSPQNHSLYFFSSGSFGYRLAFENTLLFSGVSIQENNERKLFFFHFQRDSSTTQAYVGDVNGNISKYVDEGVSSPIPQGNDIHLGSDNNFSRGNSCYFHTFKTNNKVYTDSEVLSIFNNMGNIAFNDFQEASQIINSV